MSMHHSIDHLIIPGHEDQVTHATTCSIKSRKTLTLVFLAKLIDTNEVMCQVISIIETAYYYPVNWKADKALHISV